MSRCSGSGSIDRRQDVSGDYALSAGSARGSVYVTSAASRDDDAAHREHRQPETAGGDHYLTPGVPGYSDVHIYPATPDVAKARQLARGRAGTTAVLYTCNAAPCDQQAQIIKTDLAAIGMRVKIKAFAVRTLFTKEATPGEPFDIGLGGWRSDYPDPVPTLNLLLEGGTAFPTLDDRAYAARLATAAKLTGPQCYLTYARLDADLARDAAPLVAYGNPASHELFSARMGCQTYGVYGLDLAALCVKRGTR
jgi:ABC-type transport system substrate-binding protein